METETMEQRSLSLDREKTVRVGSTEKSDATSGIPSASHPAIFTPSRNGALSAATTGASVAATTSGSSSSSDDDMTDTDENVRTLLCRE